MLKINKSTVKLVVIGVILAGSIVFWPQKPVQYSACAGADDARLVCEEKRSLIGEKVVELARSQIGTPYVYGACHWPYPYPSYMLTNRCGGNNFDCSGLAKWAWAMAGIEINGSQLILPTKTMSIQSVTAWMWNGRDQYASYKSGGYGLAYDYYKDWIKPGDLVMFGEYWTNVHHVAIYSGNGKYIEAPYTGSSVREITWSRQDVIGVLRPAE